MVAPSIKHSPGWGPEFDVEAAVVEKDSFNKLDVDLEAIAESEDNHPHAMAARDSQTRSDIADRLVEKINSVIDIPYKTTEPTSPALQELREKGVFRLKPALSTRQIKEIKEFLKDKPVCNQHVPPGQSSGPLEKATSRFNSYFPEDTLACPHLLEEIALNKDILAIVAEYLGCMPSLYSINVFWMLSKFTPSSVSGIQQFHRDYDDYKNVVVFLYLTDVSADDAPHMFVTESHKVKLKDESSQSHDESKVVILTGLEGSTFVEDVYGMHSGGSGNKLKKDRLVVWFRFGLHRNYPTKIQTRRPVPLSLIEHKNLSFDKYTKFITRFLVNHNE